MSVCANTTPIGKDYTAKYSRRPFLLHKTKLYPLGVKPVFKTPGLICVRFTPLDGKLYQALELHQP